MRYYGIMIKYTKEYQMLRWFQDREDDVVFKNKIFLLLTRLFSHKDVHHDPR